MGFLVSLGMITGKAATCVSIIPRLDQFTANMLESKLRGTLILTPLFLEEVSAFPFKRRLREKVVVTDSGGDVAASF